MRRRHTGGHQNHERWLVSYADFITLLFAFFVVLFATTQDDRIKAKAVSAAVREALEHGPLKDAIMAAFGRHGRAAEAPKEKQSGSPEGGTTDLTQSLHTLRTRLAGELKASKVNLRLENRGLIVSLRESAFFASGDDRVAVESLPILEKLAAVIRGLPNQVRLEGYTDSVPIHNARFRSNWELSAARAIRVLELLRDRFQIPVSRMAIAGYGENAPADTNETVEGRARNRRVDLVVLSAEGQRMEPVLGHD